MYREDPGDVELGGMARQQEEKQFDDHQDVRATWTDRGIVGVPSKRPSVSTTPKPFQLGLPVSHAILDPVPGPASPSAPASASGSKLRPVKKELKQPGRGGGNSTSRGQHSPQQVGEVRRTSFHDLARQASQDTEKQ